MSALLAGMNQWAAAGLAALLNTLWYAAAVVALAWVVLRYSRRVNAATRYWIWMAVLGFLVILPFLPALVVQVRTAIAVPAQATAVIEPLATVPAAPAAAPQLTPITLTLNSAPGSNPWPLWLLAVWGIAAIWQLGRLLLSAVSVRRMKARAEDAPISKLPLDLRRRVRVLASAEVGSPAAVGYWRPAVVVPQGLLDRLEEGERQDVLLHELAHLARFDDWLNLATRAVGALLVLHPLAPFVLGRIEREREMACDDFVVARTGSAGGYARSLARLHDLRSSKGTRLLAPALLGRNVSLADRIESLLRRGREFSTRPSLAKLGVSALLLAVLLGAGGLLPGWIAVAQTAGGRSGKVWTILRQVGERYSNLKSYRFTGTDQVTIEVGGSRYQGTDSFEFASAGTPQSTGFRVKFVKFEKIAGNGPSKPGLRYATPSPALYLFDRLPESVASARLLGEGTVVANGKNERCFIIQIHWRRGKDKPEITEGNVETLWVAKSSDLVLRITFSKFNDVNSPNPHVRERWVTTFNSYQLNAPVPEWLRDVKTKSEEQDRALSARMTGRQAPAFTLNDLEGNSVSLNRLRGKIVLLDFWATWCGPCREEESVLENLERERGTGSLAVLRITDQAPELVRRYFHGAGKSFPTLVEGESVSRSYEVRGVPTVVVVNKTGKIVAYHVGFLDESQLGTELKKAGV